MAPHDVWSAWSLNPAVAVIAVAAIAYARGVRQIRRRAGGRRSVAPGRVAAYFGGLAVVAVALVSPLEALSAVLFSAHMVQHLLLTLVAAPLLVVARPGRALLRALPPMVTGPGRRFKMLRHAATWPRSRWLVLTWLLATGSFWAWHVPALYEAALQEPFVHVAEHVTLFGSAWLFWWAVIDLSRRATPGLGVVAIFLASLTSGVLGALLTLSGRQWYEPRPALEAWGLTAMEDQQLAGIIMWMPGGLVYLVVGVALFGVWLKRLATPSSHRSRRRHPLRA